MKLSFKFFCIAYIVVLLSTGLGGVFIIKSINDTLWNTRVERANAAVNYAADSFLALADISYDAISETTKSDVIRQIKNTADDVISELELYTEKAADSRFDGIDNNECAVTYLQKDNRFLMQSVCKSNAGGNAYYLVAFTDFSDIRSQQDLFWNGFRMVVLGIAVISGLILLLFAKKITKPLNRLTKAADEIAMGKYGRQVNVRSSDREIMALSQSVNSMSLAVKERIEEVRRELEKRDVFVADFTHEIKTPMTALIGYAEMLRSYELDESEKQEAANAIYHEAKRLEKLSLQLLDLYIYRNEKVEMANQDLFAIAEQLKNTLNILSKKYEVSCEICFDPATVWASRELLLSLLYNLADNAFKASSSHSVVRIYSCELPDRIQIKVEDHGRGIEKENIKRITEPFFREDKSRSRKLGGAGLGLSLCKEIAKIHGTELQFESEKGKGTTVSFSLKKGLAENE